MTPWSACPYSLVSFYEMQQFAAHQFVNLMGLLARMETFIHTLTARWGSMSAEQFQRDCVEQVNDIEGHLFDLKNHCLTLELVVTFQCLKDFSGRLRMLDLGACGASLREVRRLIEYELQTKTFMYIPQEKIRYFNDTRELFGPSTLEKFPSVISEVEEAGKCYACGRDTASVFHLLRIMEAGIKVVAHTLSINTDNNRSWDALLKKIAAAVQVQHPHDEWTGFYTDLGARIHTVKDAWRNPTMHIERSYSSEEALDIFNGVYSFMRYLSTKLSEVKSLP